MRERELTARTGSVRQVCRIDRLVHDDGPARGARLVRMVTGGGLEVELHPDRCLDVGHVTYRGFPLAWASPAPVHAPAFAEHAGMGWLRTFAGGLMVTCGLDQFGAPSRAGDEALGLHGRASTLAAEHLSTSAGWHDGRYELEVRATMRQARLFGEDLVLERTVRSALGARGFEIEDVVRNQAAQSQEHMLLYHVNLGWPLLDEGVTVDLPSQEVVARDAAAEPALTAWRTIGPPEPGATEQVLRHRLPAEAPVEVRVANERLGLTFVLGFDTRELPHLFMWRMLGAGAYVLGLEPATNAEIGGRARARDVDRLPPGGARTYRLTMRVDEH
jgi:hypothetical protein